MPGLSRMIKDDSYCLGWLKEESTKREKRSKKVFFSCASLPLIKGFLLHDINSLTCGPSQSQKMSAIFSITADINDILASMYLTRLSFCSSQNWDQPYSISSKAEMLFLLRLELSSKRQPISVWGSIQTMMMKLKTEITFQLPNMYNICRWVFLVNWFSMSHEFSKTFTPINDWPEMNLFQAPLHENEDFINWSV